MVQLTDKQNEHFNILLFQSSHCLLHINRIDNSACSFPLIVTGLIVNPCVYVLQGSMIISELEHHGHMSSTTGKIYLRVEVV